MSAQFANSRREARDLLPSNLGEWVEPPAMEAWIAEEVDKLDWSNPAVVKYLQNHPSYQPRRLLQLLTQAYATGVYSSETIARMAHANDRARTFQSVTAETLRRFRRENRLLLKYCLVHLLRRAVQHHFAETRLPVGMKGILLENALVRLNLARDADTEPD